MADFVGGRAAQVERRGGRSNGSRVLVSVDHSVRCRTSAGELGVTEDAASDVTDPEIEVVGVGPGVRSALAGELDRVSGAKPVHRSGHTQDARGGVALRVKTGEAEFDLRIGCLRPGVIGICIEPAEVGVQHIQLGLDLSFGDVLFCCAVDDVENHRNRHDRILIGGTLLCYHGRPFCCVFFDALLSRGILL